MGDSPPAGLQYRRALFRAFHYRAADSAVGKRFWRQDFSLPFVCLVEPRFSARPANLPRVFRSSFDPKGASEFLGMGSGYLCSLLWILCPENGPGRPGISIAALSPS